jgi:ribosome-associated protein YbcJ (S4-like RNA binding protein)
MLWDESTDDLVLAGAAKLYLYDAGGGEYISSSGSALTLSSGGTAWELPAADGSANQVLKTDGSGNLDWASITSATVTALNNATANELVTVGATTTELDAEANLTFDGTDMLIGGAGKLQLRDTAIFINSSTDGQLDIDADTEVEITATTVDLNGILDVSGVIVAGGQISASDGTAGAPSISNTGDLNTGLLFSAADTMQFSSGGTAQFTMADGAITPVTDNDVDLGSNSLQFKNLYVNGTTYTDAIGFGTVVMTLPTADGDADQVLKTDGSGTIGFATSSGIGMGKAIAAALVFG